MTLSAGARLGPYEILSALGAGGMGEVYRARDTNLKRDVALKILPDSFANDPERLARFQREAEVLASLNHPNIAHIHGLEASNAVRALVIELVDGEDLSLRIARGPIPLDEALPIAKQIAEALEAAHEQGIIHRDLKPANIKVRSDGTVKVLDFGLAKLIERDGNGRSGGLHATQSPTITSSAQMTGVGVILGTAAYMSPEQARGAAADKRADLWAFGVVLWEMLTATRLFECATLSDTLAAVLKTEPSWQALAPATPSAIRRLLRRCLEKDRKRRMDSASDARLEIDEAIAEATTMSPQAVPRRTSAPWVVIAVAAVGALMVGALADRALTTAPPRRDLVHLSMSVAPADQVAAGGGITPRPSRTAFSVSPDGRSVVFSGTRGATTQLFRRDLDQAAATPLDGTKDGGSPLFSPDGQWIAFFSNGKLKKVPVAGGPAIDICDLGKGNLLWGADWGSKGTIAFSTQSAIMQVSSSGGTPQELVKGRGLLVLVLPHWLPGEKGLLYTTNQNLNDWTEARVVARSAAGGDPHTLVEGGSDARYVPTGHLVYMKAGTLVAVTFDAARLEITGSPVTLMNDVMQAVNSTASYVTGAGQFAVAAAGTLAYLPGGVFRDPVAQLIWVDRRGAETPLIEPPGPIYNMRLSPDGRYLAYAKARAGSINRDIWEYDFERNTSTRLTLAEPYRGPVWAPDGQHLIFSSMNRDALYAMPTSGEGSPQRLTTIGQNNDVSASSISDSGLLAFVAGSEIWTLSFNGDRKPQLFLKSPDTDTLSHPAISPDGRWLAYSSNESTRGEVYIRPYPGPGTKTRISLQGGTAPVWARSGREMFYVQLPVRSGETNITMMVTDIDTTRGSPIGTPRALFSGPYVSLSPTSGYDVSTDGQRFITLKPMDNGEKPATQIEIVLNWTDELRRRVVAK